MENRQFSWTGNPFVDTGLCVIIARAKEIGKNIQTISDVTIDIIKEVVGDGSWLAAINARLNSYTLVFGNNSPLKQTATNPISQLNSHRKKIKEKKQEIQIIESEINNKVYEITREQVQKKHIALEKNIEDLNKKKQKKYIELNKLESKLVEKEKKAEGGFDRGIEEYKIVVNTLIEAIESNKHSLNTFCECCGIYEATKSLKIASGKIRKVGKDCNDEKMAKRLDFEVGRDWFPLIGSFNDAQALPAASRSANICALCLLAVQFLPLGVLLLNGKLVCFQTNDVTLGKPPIFQLLVEEVYEELSKRFELTEEKMQILGKEKGTKSTALVLVKRFKDLQDYKQGLELADYVSLNMWLFTNSGTNPDCEIIEIPNKSLSFLWKVSRLYSSEITAFIHKEDDKNPDYQLFTAIEKEKEYFKFFPKYIKVKPFFKITEESLRQLKKSKVSDEVLNLLETLKGQIYEKEDKFSSTLMKLAENNKQIIKDKSKIIKLAKNNKDDICEIASRGLFELYNRQILHISNTKLKVAEWVAEKIKYKLNSKEKELEDIKRSLGDSKKMGNYYSKVRSYLSDFAENGDLKLEEYNLLFPSELHPLKAQFNKGLRLIWFYLNHDTTNTQRVLIDGELQMFTQPKIKQFAKDIFEYFTVIQKWQSNTFKKRILERFKRGDIKNLDIQRWFLNLAEIKTGYTNEDWDDLCRDDNGNNITNEVIFQLRLELTNLYRLAVEEKQQLEK